MSESNTPTIADRNNAAIAHAKANPAESTVKFPAGEFLYYPAIVTSRKQVKEGGKKKMVETEHTVVRPVIETAEDAKRFVALVLDSAESRAVELFEKVFGDHLEDASNESFNVQNGTEDLEKMIHLTISPERPRSAGLKMEDINQRISVLTPEFMSLIDAANKPGAWAGLKDDTGAQLFTNEEQFNLRLVNLSSELKKLSAQAEEKRKKLAEIKAKREEKAAAATAAAKQNAVQIAS